MRTISLSCLALAVIGTLGGAIFADDTPRALIEKALKARGDDEQAGPSFAVQTRHKGTIFLPGGVAPNGISLTALSRDQSGAHYIEMIAEFSGQKLTFKRVLRDGKGWHDINGAIADLDADEVAEAKESDYVDRVIDLRRLLKDKEFTLEALGKSDVAGVEVLGVKVSSRGNPDVKLYFERTSGLLKQYEYRAQRKKLSKEVLMKTVLDDYREINPVAEEERSLKAVGVGTDGAGLMKYLRGRVRSEADREKVKALIRQLGDDSFEDREKATADLIQLGEVALPELRAAAKSNDAEVARRARHCLSKIDETKDSLPAVLRLVAFKRPAGAVEVLLDLTPSLTDEDGIRELRGALAALALTDGKPDKLLEKALEDKDPTRRAAAAAALGKDGGAFAKQANRRLYLRAVKRAMKETSYEDGTKQGELEVVEVQFYNRFEDKVFDKPK